MAELTRAREEHEKHRADLEANLRALSLKQEEMQKQLVVEQRECAMAVQR